MIIPKQNKKIIFGTRSLSGDFGKIAKKEIYFLLEYAIKSGFLHFDTSQFYGDGQINNILSNFKKDKIIIDAKCGYNFDGTKKNFSLSDIKRNLDYYLKRFTRLIYLHNPREEIKNWDKIFISWKT